MDEHFYTEKEPRNDAISSSHSELPQSAHRYHRYSNENGQQIKHNEEGYRSEHVQEYEPGGRREHQQADRDKSVILDRGVEPMFRVISPQRRTPMRRTSGLVRRDDEQAETEPSAMQHEHLQDDVQQDPYSTKLHEPKKAYADPFGDTIPLWMADQPAPRRQSIFSRKFSKSHTSRRQQAADLDAEKSPVRTSVPQPPPSGYPANSRSQRSSGGSSNGGSSNGSGKTMHRIVEPKASGFRKLIQRFDFKWYGVTMGTGIVSIILFTFSELYEDSFSALRILSYAFFFMNAGIFGVVSLLTVLRYLMYPRLFMFLISDPAQSTYLGTVPMGLATIITMIVNVAVKQLGGTTWPLVAWGLWWFDAIISVGVALGVPLGLMTKPEGGVALSTMTAGWLLPVVAPIVAAATGAAVAAVLTPDQALITIMVSFALLGMGLPMAFLIITIYFHRLTTHGLPPPEHMMSVFLPLGPLGQGGYASQKLGAQALKTLVAMNSLPKVGSEAAGQIFYVLGFVFAWILWGFGTVWLFFAVFSITSRKFPFGMGWWAFTFPLGVFAMSTLTLGQELPSLFMRIVGTVLGIQVMINWLFVAIVMFSKLMSGHVWDVFKAPELYGNKNERWEYD